MYLCKQGSTAYLVTMELRAQQKVIAVYARDDEQREAVMLHRSGHTLCWDLFIDNRRQAFTYMKRTGKAAAH